ncbi:MAG: transglycosylase [Alphaproteobacteria bacterium]|nr:transglycosylase [Alphaproteobacteria bacterium]
MRPWPVRLGLVLLVLALDAMPASSSQQLLTPLRFTDIGSWPSDDHGAALAAFRRSCAEIVAEGRAFARPVRFGGERRQWLDICDRAATAGDARQFFETNFVPFKVREAERPEGLFTGYYEPEAEGSLTPSAQYPAPIYGKPSDLVAFDDAAKTATGLSYGRIVDGEPRPYFTRREIEEGALANRGLEIVWLRDWVDAFFIHVQGSGRVRLADGGTKRLAYAGKSGRPYTSIGGVLVERGELTRETMSMQSLRQWMARDPQAARDLMWQNESFIFFREVELADADLGAPGAQQVQLTPLRSLAVDRSIWMFGTPVWLDTSVPDGKGGEEAFRHLMIAQDTGSAIRGAARGDIYFGFDPLAGERAGRMKAAGTMIVLLPRALAETLDGRP